MIVNKEVEDKLFELYELYLKTNDINYLGQMLSPNLLPTIADVTMWKMVTTFGLYIPHQDEIKMDAMLRLIERIQNGLIIKSWWGKMYGAISVQLRKQNIDRKREIPFSLLKGSNDSKIM